MLQDSLRVDGRKGLRNVLAAARKVERAPPPGFVLRHMGVEAPGPACVPA